MNLKINKLTKIGLLVTIVLTFFVSFTGFFEVLFLQYQATFTLYLDSIHFSVPIKFYLDSGVLMIGMGIGISSIFMEKRKNLFSHVSVMSIILGFGILAVIMGYVHPGSIGSGMQVPDLESFFMEYLSLVIHNISVAFISLLSGPTIIGPYLVLSNIVIIPVSWLTSLVMFYGYNGIILFFGLLHIYPEFYAIFLACLAGIRVALESFKSFTTIKREGFKSTFKTIKTAMISEIRNTMPRIIILLVIAALLETLWTPFWVNYWLKYIL